MGYLQPQVVTGAGQKVKLFLDLGCWPNFPPPSPHHTIAHLGLLLLAINAGGNVSHCRQQSVV